MSAFTDASRRPIIRVQSGVITSVGPSQTAQVKIPVGVTTNTLAIRCRVAGAPATRAQLESSIGNMRLIVSGVEKMPITATQHIAIQEFYNSGVIGDSGYLYFPFSRSWMESIADQLNPAYGTVNENSFILELEQTAGSVIDQMDLITEVFPIAEELGGHVLVRRTTVPVTSTGLFIYNDLPRNAGEDLLAVHFQVPVVANLTNIAVVASDIRLFDVPASYITQMYKQSVHARRTPQPGFVHLDFLYRNLSADALLTSLLAGSGGLSFELTFANAAPGSVTFLAEYLSVKPTTVSQK